MKTKTLSEQDITDLRVVAGYTGNFMMAAICDRASRATKGEFCPDEWRTLSPAQAQRVARMSREEARITVIAALTKVQS